MTWLTARLHLNALLDLCNLRVQLLLLLLQLLNLAFDLAWLKTIGPQLVQHLMCLLELRLQLFVLLENLNNNLIGEHLLRHFDVDQEPCEECPFSKLRHSLQDPEQHGVD